jgi:hypothetical protein
VPDDDGYFDERIAARYGESSAGMFDAAAVDPVVDFLFEMAGSGRALELGIGRDTPDELRDDPEAVASTLPDGRIVVIDGQQHIADVLVPEAFAELVLSFLRDKR